MQRSMDGLVNVVHNIARIVVQSWHITLLGHDRANGVRSCGEQAMRAREIMTDLSASTLSYLHFAATVGLVICLIMAGAFATLGFVTTGEQGRRQSAVEADRLARITALLEETDAAGGGELAAVADEDPTRDEGIFERPALPDSAAEPSTEAADTIVSTFAAVDDGDGGGDGGGDGDLPLAAGRSIADLFASTGPLPDVPPEAAAILTAPLRRLSADEAATLAAALSNDAGNFTVEVLTAPENEARVFASELAGALRSAGIDARGPITVLTTAQTDGMLVSATADEDGPSATVLTALQASGLSARPALPGTPAADILAPDVTDVRIYVGGLRSSPAKPDKVVVERAAPKRVLEDA